jgi:rod shape-determining protein MreC
MAPAGTLNRSLMISAGLEEGVRKNQPVIAAEGLIGRVIDVGKHSARVLLITDAASRIPAAVESSREQLILAGDNSERPVMTHMVHNNLPKPGEVIVTSGKGGIFPPGLEIGRVVKQGSSGSLRIHTPIRWNQLEFVQVLAPSEMQTAHTTMH